MSGVRFNRWSSDEICGKTVIYKGREAGCFRRDGHDGDCIAMMADAANADGVMHCCRMPLDALFHHPKCPNT